MIANGRAEFPLSQSEGLRLSPKGVRAPPLVLVHRGHGFVCRAARLASADA